MLYNVDDFQLTKNDKKDGHNDFWFNVSGETQKHIEKETWEMCMVGWMK